MDGLTILKLTSAASDRMHNMAERKLIGTFKFAKNMKNITYDSSTAFALAKR